MIGCECVWKKFDNIISTDVIFCVWGQYMFKVDQNKFSADEAHHTL